MKFVASVIHRAWARKELIARGWDAVHRSACCCVMCAALYCLSGVRGAAAAPEDRQGPAGSGQGPAGAGSEEGQGEPGTSSLHKPISNETSWNESN
eukprot:scaffold52791_cov29-Prasinocladus_malaysianus.AAC.2